MVDLRTLFGQARTNVRPVEAEPAAVPPAPELEVSDRPEPADVAAVAAGLLAHNEDENGPSGLRGLSVLVRGPHGEVRAGLVGRTAWGWLFIEKVWVGPELRGRGVGRALIGRAEAEARARGCAQAWLDTHNPRAHDLYRRLGYEPFGQLDGYVGSRARFFLRKVL